MSQKNSKYSEARRLRVEQGLAGTDIAQILNVAQTTVYKWLRDVEITPDQKTALAQHRIDAAMQVVKKTDLREEARRLRSESGLSVKEIVHKLDVSQSSVSLWVRDVELNVEQSRLLEQKRSQHLQFAQEDAAQANRDKFLKLRLTYQQEGRVQAQKHDPLHVAGCMLYWAEGKKQHNALSLVNSDPDMLKFYVRFLWESLGVADEAMKIHINCYTNNGLAVEEIETYWLSILGLTQSNLRKTVVNQQPISSKQKGRKLFYGVCSVSVYSTRIVQHIYGAIQEYIGVDKPEWIE